MGVLTDFFIATADEVAAFDLEESPADHFPTLQRKGLDPLVVSVLHAILRNEPLDDTERVLDLLPRSVREHEDPDTGMQICELDADFVARVAAASRSVVETTAARWARTEEVSGWDAADLENAIVAMRDFFGRRRSEDQRVYLWVCL